jgi:hypothetical protein
MLRSSSRPRQLQSPVRSFSYPVRAGRSRFVGSTSNQAKPDVDAIGHRNGAAGTAEFSMR